MANRQRSWRRLPTSIGAWFGGVGIGENRGNLPRGTWLLDGVFTVEFSSTGYRTVTMARGTQHNVCTDID